MLTRINGPIVTLLIVEAEPVVITRSRHQKSALSWRKRIGHCGDGNHRNVRHAKPPPFKREVISGVEIQILEPKSPGRRFSFRRVAVGKPAFLEAIMVFRKSLNQSSVQRRIRGL